MAIIHELFEIGICKLYGYQIGHGPDDLGFESRQEQEIYLFIKTCRLAQGSTQWVAGALSPVIKRLGGEVDSCTPSCAGEPE
jgi:hypothetical protein